VSVAIDVNPLLYAAFADSPFYHRARDVLGGFAGGQELVYVFWPVVMEFLRISTNGQVYRDPLAPADAERAMASLLSLPNVRTGAESASFRRTYCDVSAETVVRGKLVSDAHLVALMRQHGVSAIYTHDRDFRKFDGVRVVDPFI
jgi:uncharacterized protein